MSVAPSPNPGCTAATERRRIVLGSRGSELARAQTKMVVEVLQKEWPELDLAVEIVCTTGDVLSKEKPSDLRAGRKGAFTAEIERALSSGKIDIAIHSAKDLPTELMPDLELGGVLPRGVVDDVLVQKESGHVLSSRPTPIVATGSVRRQHQLRWKYPAVTTIDLRGNVPTRLRKLLASSWDGVVLARAGLERLGYDMTTGQFSFEGAPLYAHVLSGDEFLPACGQGVIVMQVRSSDVTAGKMAEGVNHNETKLCLRAEREFLRLLAGDCNSPIGVLGSIEEDQLSLRAQVFDGKDDAPKTGMVSLSLRSQAPEAISRILYDRMYARG